MAKPVPAIYSCTKHAGAVFAFYFYMLTNQPKKPKYQLCVKLFYCFKCYKSMVRVFILVLAVFISGCGTQNSKTDSVQTKNMDYKVVKSDSEWQAQLSAEEFRVLRQKGTERPFSGEFETHWDTGTYVCKACNAVLFSSSTKFDAHCGWPSFYETIDKSAVKEIRDVSHGMVRVEVVCANCGGHLGHVFDDGVEQPTGLRYCINSVSIGFKKQE